MSSGGHGAKGGAAPAIAYEPGLDGLRALALFTILLFHARISWALGGFISVSLFFTLSGYLITTLVLQEIDRTRRVDLRRFLLRRVRRLAPGSYLALLFVVLTATWYEASGNALKLRGDIFAAAGYVANWRFLFDHQSYADLFRSGPSPVLHFWSLAIEEQFYLFFPVLLAFGAWIGRRAGRRSMPEILLVVVTVASIVVTVLNTDSDAAYYATHLRAAELFAGGVLAIVVRRVGLEQIREHPTPWWVGGVFGLVLYLVLCGVVEQEAVWFDRGGFIPFTLLWSLLILAVLVKGPMRRVFGIRPLTYIGQLSFSLYLYHWPVYLILDEERTGLSLWPTLLLRWAVTLALGAASYHFVEQPIRDRRIKLRTWRGGLAYLTVIALSVGVATIRLQPDDAAATMYDQMLDAPDDVTVIGDAASATTVPVEPFVVVVVGSDSGALAVVEDLAASTGATVVDLTDPGCTMLDPTRTCLAPSVRYAQYASSNGAPDRVVLVTGSAEHGQADQRIATADALGPEALGQELSKLAAEIRFVGLLRNAVPVDVPITVVDRLGGPEASFSKILRPAVISMVNGALVPIDELDPDLFRPEDAPSDRPRLLVIGDSTSYGVSLEADRLAPGAYEIVWAGYRNCPMVPVAEVRWFEGAQWTMEDCVEAQRRWPQVIADFQPDVLLVILSLPEHSDQRYFGDDRWYTSLDARFVEEHDAVMSNLLGLLEPYGTRVLIANSPPSYMSPKDRVDAWNALLETWAARWPQISIVDFATPVAAAEEAAGGSLRPDNIHLDDATLEIMMRQVFLPAIAAAADEAAPQVNPDNPAG